MLNRSLIENLAVRGTGTPGGAWPASAIVGSYEQMQGYHRALLIGHVGALDANVTLEVMEATDDAGTSAQELTGPTTGETFTNGTDESRVGLIEIRQGDLSAGYTHIAARITGDAGQSLSAVFVFTDSEFDYPVSNGTADGVAFTAAATD